MGRVRLGPRRRSLVLSGTWPEADGCRATSGESGERPSGYARAFVAGERLLVEGVPPADSLRPSDLRDLCVVVGSVAGGDQLISAVHGGTCRVRRTTAAATTATSEACCTAAR